MMLIVAAFVGCALVTDTVYEGILQKPFTQWNTDECRMVLGRSLAHNAKDEDAPIRVFALPFSPMIITALNREDQIKKHLSEDEYQASIQQQARECLGMFVDWKTDTYLDANGRIYRNAAQMDSLLFLITFENIPGQQFVNVITTDLFVSDHASALGNPLWFGPLPLSDLNEITDRVFLQNAPGERIPPRLIWMRKQGAVTKDESILAMFDLRRGGKNFLEGSDYAEIVITGFTKDVRLGYRLALGQFQAMNLH